MRWITIRQLKALRRLPIPPEVLEAGRRRLLIVMAESPMAPGASRFHAFVWKPALAAFVVVIFVAASGSGVVYASQGSLPGDALYTVKLASEGVQERLAVSADKRFAVQADHAARRLEETKELMQKTGLDMKEREARVRVAMDGYQRRLTDMNDIAAKIEAKPKPTDPDMNAVEAAERVLDRHAELVASATASEPDVAETVIGHIDGSIRLEDDVYSFARRRRDSWSVGSSATSSRTIGAPVVFSSASSQTMTGSAESSDSRLDEHRRQRGDQLIGQLRSLRAGLNQKALENKAEK